MKLTIRETKVVEETIEVPDHFSHDHSVLGQVVDILVGNRRRDDLWSDEKYVIERAVADLTEAYEKAEKILIHFECKTNYVFSRKSVG